MMRLRWATIFVMTLATPTFAEIAADSFQQAPDAAISPAKPLTLLAQANAAHPDAERETVSDPPPGYSEWRERVGESRARKSHADTLILSGGGIALVSALASTAVAVNHGTTCVGTAMSNTSIPNTTNTCVRSITNPLLYGAVGEVIGGTMVAIGRSHRCDANDDLDRLYEEGGRRGFVWLAPAPGGGVQGAWTLLF
jgi:hypothetical protein